MKWKGRRESGNVEDRREMGGKRGIAAGGIGMVVILVLGLIMGKNPLEMLQMVNQNPQIPAEQGPVTGNPEEDEAAAFVKVVLADNEDVWNKLFADAGMAYTEPTLVLFRGAVESGCGNASATMGPFYCPADQKMYIDLSFYDELKEKFNAPGDFAMAYVVAHENGHHIQHLLGTADKVHRMRNRVSREEYNRLSVKLELQADFYAGVWAHHADKMKDILEPGDIEEALNAAHAIGDDKLQKQAQGYVVPDAFTHGTSEQRMRWFKKGYESGDLREGDTFNADEL